MSLDTTRRGRKLQGRKVRVATGWQYRVPRARGDKRQVSLTVSIHDESLGDEWFERALAALAAGTPLPPKPDRSGSPTTPIGTACEEVAAALLHEYFSEFHIAGGARQRSVEADLAYIGRWMAKRGLVMETLGRDQVKQLLLGVAGRGPIEHLKPVPYPHGITGDTVIAHPQAHTFDGTPSQSTLKRMIKPGRDKTTGKELPPLLPSWIDGGTRYVRARDLFSNEVTGGVNGRRRGPRSTVPGTRIRTSQASLADFRRTLQRLIDYARAVGVAVPPNATLGIQTPHVPRKPPKERALERKPVPLASCARIAEHLHVVHQLALWLLRICELRIGEAFGLIVSDIADFGAGAAGLLEVERQGGRTFLERDAVTGELYTTDTIDRGKTEQSYRVLVVPPQLMDLLRTVIVVFHTRDGVVDTRARLIPPLRSSKGGQSAFRTALKAAAAVCGIDDDGLDERRIGVSPHALRRSAITDVAWSEVERAAAMRYSGHRAGDDVYYTNYVMDDPTFEAPRQVAAELARQIDAELDGQLMIPTSVRCTTGNQPHLAVDGACVDAKLAAVGWQADLLTDGDRCVPAADVARVLDCTVQTARRWMAEGRLPSVVHAERARGAERRARIRDVLAFGEHLTTALTIARLADAVGRTYDQVYAYIRLSGLDLDDCGARGRRVPPATADAVRDYFAGQDALRARAMPISDAANMWGWPVSAVQALIDAGTLVADEATADGEPTVTRDSVAHHSQGPTATSSRPRTAFPGLCTLSSAAELLGKSEAEVRALVASHQLEGERRGRRSYVTRASLRRVMLAEDG